MKHYVRFEISVKLPKYTVRSPQLSAIFLKEEKNKRTGISLISSFQYANEKLI